MNPRHLFLLLGSVLLLAAPSCVKEDANRERSEKIEVFPSREALLNPKSEPVGELGVDVRGGVAEIYVRSNVEITASWQDAFSAPWAEVLECEPVASMDNVFCLKLKVSRLSQSCDYNKRVGTLMLNNKPIALAKFVRVYQGLTTRLSCDFSSLVSGSDDPRSESGDIPILQWSESLKSRYRFSSTPFADGDVAYCYSKKGYMRLGDKDGHGADLTTWYVSEMRSDSLLMVSFKAVAYTGADGRKDSNKFSVEVSGGGEIRDFMGKGIRKIELEAPNFDANSRELASSMWKGSDFLVFIAGTKTNPLTADTRITISVGDLKKTGEPGRLFIDDLYVRTADPLMGEDYFEANEGSGKDRILGARTINANQ